jgi:hypothetical protein
MLGAADPANGVPNWALVTMMREPVSHFLSWFYYYSEPDNHMTLDAYVATGRGANGSCTMHTVALTVVSYALLPHA